MNYGSALRNTWLWVLALAALAAVTAATVASAQQPPGPPHQFDGSVRIDGRPAPAGTSVFAVVDGQRCGVATVTSTSTYVLYVPTACAEDGDTVHFRVGGTAADETGTFAAGSRTALNLTVEVPAPENPTPPPTPIPTPTATATPSAEPNTPTNFVVSSITNSGVTLSWAAGAAGDCPATGYELDVEDPHGQVDWGSGSITATTATVTGLTPGTEYTASVIAFSSTCGSYSDDYAYATFTTTGAAPPTATPPGPPHEFDGSVRIDGRPAAAGTSLLAVVDGQPCGTATVTSSSTYILHVSTECAVDGDTVYFITVHFIVGVHVAVETGTYATGTRTALNLTVNTGMGAGDMDEPAEPGMGDGDGDMPAIEVTLWRSVADPSVLYLSARPAGGSWRTEQAPLDMSRLSRSGRFHRSNATTVMVLLTGGGRVNVEVTVWRSVTNPSILYLSTRPEGGSWRTEQAPLDMPRLSRSGRFHQSSPITVLTAPETPDAASP